MSVPIILNRKPLRRRSKLELRWMRLIHPKQAWFWTEEWHEGELEADRDLREGRYTVFENMDAFIAGLGECR